MPASAAYRTALDALGEFLRDSAGRERPVLQQKPLAALAAEMDLERLIADGGLGDGAFRHFLDAYLGAATRLYHPGYMGHQVTIPHEMGTVAALIDAVTNNPMAIYEMGPSAATVEFTVINWMLRKAGWRPAPPPGGAGGGEPCGGGVLTHGGSLANLTALMAARARVAPDAWREGTPRDLVICAPEASHYSIARAADIFGLGRKALKAVPCDGDGRIVPGELAPFLAKLRADGHRVLAVVANACATAAGLYDRLRDIAEVCREAGVWLHVDGAHGASALVSARERHKLDGLELADSLVWDAHKMLRCPSLCAAVLVREARWLDSAFHDDASYLFHDKEQPGVDLIHRTVECTKAALGLKLFMVLAAGGEAEAGRFVERQTDLAREAAAWLRARPDFEVAAEPESNIVCCRVAGSDALQLRIRERLIAAGSHYISTAEFRARRWLRLVLMNPATEMRDIESFAAEVRRHRDAAGTAP